MTDETGINVPAHTLGVARSDLNHGVRVWGWEVSENAWCDIIDDNIKWITELVCVKPRLGKTMKLWFDGRGEEAKFMMKISIPNATH